MPWPMSDRLRQLQKMLERQPDDAFLLYGVAMEHKKAGDAAGALEYLGRVTHQAVAEAVGLPYEPLKP